VFGATLAKVLLLSVNVGGFLVMAVTDETRAPPVPLTPFSKLCAQPIAHPTRRPESRTKPKLVTLSSPCRLGWEGYGGPDNPPYVMGDPTVPPPIQRGIAVHVSSRTVRYCVACLWY
jgi:hypothetical protein